MFLFEHIKILI